MTWRIIVWGSIPIAPNNPPPPPSAADAHGKTIKLNIQIAKIKFDCLFIMIRRLVYAET
jgi:hypothetical protein